MFKLSATEIKLAVAFAVMGFVLSMREFLLWYNSFDIITGMLIYLGILYGSLYVLSMMNLVIFGIRIKDPIQTFGLVLITFAFFIIVNFESPYTQFVTMGTTEGASKILFMSEDGAAWYFWQTYTHIVDIELLRILTYVVTPFLLTLLGSLFVSEKVRL